MSFTEIIPTIQTVRLWFYDFCRRPVSRTGADKDLRFWLAKERHQLWEHSTWRGINLNLRLFWVRFYRLNDWMKHSPDQTCQWYVDDEEKIYRWNFSSSQKISPPPPSPPRAAAGVTLSRHLLHVLSFYPRQERIQSRAAHGDWKLYTTVMSISPFHSLRPEIDVEIISDKCGTDYYRAETTLMWITSVNLVK